jgi:outer membrane protein TolC
MPNRPFAGRVIAAGAIALIVTGCAPPTESLAPTTPHSEWEVPAELTAQTRQALRDTRRPAVSRRPEGPQDLAALIDLAQRLNPETRLAWEQARAAAYAVDAASAEYFPQIGAGLVFGRGRSDITYDLPGLGSTTVDNTATATVPTVYAQWLLYDSGGRDAAVRLARKLALSQNIGFNRVHQQTVLDVARAYHELRAARVQARAASEALGNTQRILSAARARRDQGVGNAVEVAQAEQAFAQAQLDAVQTRGTARSARATLLATVGVVPDDTLTIATEPMPLPTAMTERLDVILRDALAHRPDVLQAVLNLQAQRAARAGARAAFRPQIGLVASLARNEGGLAINGNRFDLPATDSLALLTLEVPIFNGGLRASRRDAAAAEVASARAELAAVRDAAEAEVITAYQALHTAIEAARSAESLVSAARTTAEATRSAYRQGMGELPDVLAAQNGLLDAEQLAAQARADAQTAVAVLAFETGTLQSTARER